jgi:hypothetical protein
MKVGLLILVFLFNLGSIIGQTLRANTTGSFIYTPPSPLNSKPITVYYRIPNGDLKNMRIMMSLHGTERNGSEYRDYWITMANDNSFMVFAPEFSNTNFPTGDKYQAANIFVDGDNPSLATYNLVNEWTISILDPLFDFIKQEISGTQEKYNAWGHSGGAQFLHRFVMYLPNSKLDIAVCSNAGWYTVPESNINFPYGIKDGQLADSTLTKAFSKKLIVHLGLNDTNPNSADLRHNTVVDNQQGTFRLIRGRYFFNTSQVKTQSMTVPFKWEKQEVAGVGHDAQLMARDALKYMLRSSADIPLSIKQNVAINSVKIYPNPTANNIYFDNTNLKINEVKVFNNNGILVKTYKINGYNAQQKIDVSNLINGLYFIMIKTSTVAFIKE